MGPKFLIPLKFPVGNIIAMLNEIMLNAERIDEDIWEN